MTKSFDPADYSTYKQADFRHRWLRPSHLATQLERLQRFPDLTFSSIGQSEEKRPLSKIEFGDGPIKVMLWTQMHGNEPTATMAIIDLLNFLTASGDIYDNLRKEIKTHLSLLIIPMLNPDGAEKFTRRNALNIDMNRDARAQQTLEMKAFTSIFKQFKPHWAFNLHDQRNIFSAGNSKHPATISFLSPSSDYYRRVNSTRRKSMQLVSVLSELIEEDGSSYCGRYSDEFYPRALGEYCHQQEVPCVLVESGAYPNDPYRDKARKLNFLIFLKAFENLMQPEFLEYDTDAYSAIPENGKNIVDLVIRNCILDESGSRVDLGLMIEEKPDFENNVLLQKYRLNDIGDLSFQYGLEEREGGRIGDIKPLKLESYAEFKIQLEDGSQITFKDGVEV
jgi:hypothetical protein